MYDGMGNYTNAHWNLNQLDNEMSHFASYSLGIIGSITFSPIGTISLENKLWRLFAP